MSDEKRTRLRIVSDGTPVGTKIYTEDGALLRGVQMVNWHLEIGGFATVQVELVGVPLDVVGLLEDEGSIPEDPSSVPELLDAEKPPEGPGFDA